MHQERQALAVDCGRLADSLPAIVDKLPIGFGVSRRADYGPVFNAGTVLVTRLVQWRKYFIGKDAGLFEHGFDQVGGGILEPGQIRDRIEARNFVDNKLHILDRCIVVGHISSLAVEFYVFVEGGPIGNYLVFR